MFDVYDSASGIDWDASAAGCCRTILLQHLYYLLCQDSFSSVLNTTRAKAKDLERPPYLFFCWSHIWSRKFVWDLASVKSLLRKRCQSGPDTQITILLFSDVTLHLAQRWKSVGHDKTVWNLLIFRTSESQKWKTGWVSTSLSLTNLSKITK